MQGLLIFIFFFLTFLLFYIFFGYPLLLFLLSFFKKPVPEPPIPAPLPFVSIVIPAYNEANHIKESIENILNIDYPKDKFEVIIVSDASTDGTDNIVANFPDKRVKLIQLRCRSGTGKAIDAGMHAARSDLVVTSDANAKMDKEMVKYLTRHFQNEGVGGVSGDKIIEQHNKNKSGKEAEIYWKYENALKNYEHKIFGVVLSNDNVNFALRKNIFTDNCPPIIGHDFWLSLYIASKGYKIIYEHKAKVYEKQETSLRNEFLRQSRVTLGGLQTILLFPHLLSLFRNPGVFLQLMSHKILRWFACIFLIVSFIVNLFLLNIHFFRITLLCQLLFYIIAAIGWIFHSVIRVKFIKIVTYFVSVNMASLLAIYNYWIKDKKSQPFWNKLRT